MTVKVEDVTDQMLHFAFVGGLTGIFAGWSAEKLGANKTLTIGLAALGAGLVGGIREFFQNFVQWDEEGGGFRIEPDEDNDYGDLALDMLFTVLGGIAAGIGVVLHD